MKSFTKKYPGRSAAAASSGEHAPRRIGAVVHDDRGYASVQWRDAPEDYRRTVLEVEDPLAVTFNSKVRGGLEILNVETGNTGDPYDRATTVPRKALGKPRDLRKLSEWIKKMRDLEERKRNGEAEAEE